MPRPARFSCTALRYGRNRHDWTTKLGLALLILAAVAVLVGLIVMYQDMSSLTFDNPRFDGNGQGDEAAARG
jgi:hypothetical protein